MIAEYHVPASVAEAVALRARLGERAVFLAGGTEVNSTAYEPHCDHIISLERLTLDQIQSSTTELVIGARCTLQQLIDAPEVPEAVRSAVRQVTNRNIRNIATVGGQLAAARAHGTLRPTLVALEAIIELMGSRGPATIGVLEYLQEHGEELITQVRIPITPMKRCVAIETFRRTANDPPAIATAVSLAADGGRVERPILAIDGAADRVTRLRSVETALDGQPPPPRDALERLAAKHVSPSGDLAGSAEFKRHIAGALVAKAVWRAFREATGPRS